MPEVAIINPPLYPLEGQGCNNKPPCFGLAGLPVVPSLGLVWPGPVLPALPATTTGRLRRLAAAALLPLLLLLLLDQARARQARQAQARPSQGKTQQASQPSQGLNPENYQISNFLLFTSTPGVRWKMVVSPLETSI